jgi:hypothetical protein
MADWEAPVGAYGSWATPEAARLFGHWSEFFKVATGLGSGNLSGLCSDRRS